MLIQTRRCAFRTLLLIISLGVVPISVQSAPHPRFGGRLQCATFQRVTTLNPAHYLNFAEFQIATNLYEGLVKRDAFGRSVSAIAQSWKHLEDYRVWEFTLAEDARFHDGTTVRAIDIKRAWKRTIRESWLGETAPSWRTPLFSIDGAIGFRNGKAQDIVGIRAVDDQHIRITLKEGDPAFLEKLAAPGAWITKPGDSTPIGTGRFRLASHTAEKIELAANTDYAWGRPYLDGITFRHYPDVREALFAFESGDLDALHLPLTEAAKRRENANERLIQTDAAIGVYLHVSMAQDSGAQTAWQPLLKYAVDVEALLRLQYGAEFARFAVAASPLRYNPTKARRRLKHTNRGTSEPLRLVYAPLPDNTGGTVATRLQRDYLSPIGLSVVVESADTFRQFLTAGTANLALLALPIPQGDAHLEPSGTLIPLYHLPSSFLCQPHLRGIHLGWGGGVGFDAVWVAR